MPKSGFAALLVLLITMLGLPPVFGIVAERSVVRTLAALPDDPVWDVSLEFYERGFYSSAATILIKSDDAYLNNRNGVLEDDEALELFGKLADGVRINLDIAHGPVGMTGNPFVGWSSANAKIEPDTPFTEGFTETLAIPYLLRINTVSGFGGTTNFIAEVPPLKVEDAERIIDFSGLSLVGSFSGIEDRLVYELVIDNVTGGSPAADYSIQGIRSSADNVFITDDLAVGKSDITIDRAEIGSVALPGSELVLENMSISMDATLGAGGEKMSADIVYLLDAITLPPATQLEGLQLVLKLGEIDIEAVQRYLELIQTMDPADGESMEALPEEMAEALYGILQGSPTFAIDPLVFRHNDASFAASVTLNLIGERLPAGPDLMQQNPAALLDAVRATASLAVDEPLAMSIAQTLMAQQLVQSLPPDADFMQEEIEATAQMQSEVLLQSFIAQGMLVRVEGEVRGEFEYADGDVMVNGKPLPLGALADGN
jgi:uncharacterized protein YdgA (DUF945 family)